MVRPFLIAAIVGVCVWLLVVVSGRSLLVWQSRVPPGQTYVLKRYGKIGGGSLACYYFTGFEIVDMAYWSERPRCPFIID